MSVRYPVEVRSTAYQAYLDGVSFPDIADKFRIPVTTLKSWAQDDGWAAKRRELRKELSEQANFEVERLKAGRLVEVVRRQLDTLEKLDKKVMSLLESKESFGSESLLNISRAIQASNAALSKLLGLEKPQATASVNVLVQTGFSPAPASVAESPHSPKTILITADEEPF